MDSSFVSVDGARLALHRSGGTGPSVVLVHGHLSAAMTFHRQLHGSFGQMFDVVAVDLPGEGSSDPPVNATATYSIPGLARTLVAVAGDADLLDAVFVGWSLGGHVLIEAMPHLPRARGFCIYGTPPLRFPPNLGEAFLPHAAMEVQFKGPLDPDDRATWQSCLSNDLAPAPATLQDEMQRRDPRLRPKLLESVGSVGYADQLEVLASVRQPVAVLHGDADHLVSGEYMRALRFPALWRSEVHVVPGAAHALQWDRRGDFERLLTAFIQDAR